MLRLLLFKPPPALHHEKLFMPVRIRINRPAIHITANKYTRLFLALFVAVMAQLAQRLEVIDRPEQHSITTMRLYVVDSIGSLGYP
jgi:hypothetical protein